MIVTTRWTTISGATTTIATCRNIVLISISTLFLLFQENTHYIVSSFRLPRTLSQPLSSRGQCFNVCTGDTRIIVSINNDKYFNKRQETSRWTLFVQKQQHDEFEHITTETMKTSSLLLSSSSSSCSRRDVVLQQLRTAFTTSLLWNIMPFTAATAGNLNSNANTIAISKPQSITSQQPTLSPQSTAMNIKNISDSNVYIAADMAKVTNKVYFNVRISRQDGTFYVRDTDDTDEENRVYNGQLQFNLFGQNAPNHVQRFLQYIVGDDTATTTTMSNNDDESTPYPSYSRSSFTQYNDATGLLYGGTIPSLEVVEIQPSVPAMRYGNRLLPAKLWLDDNSIGNDNKPKKISHNTIGLLTHEQFDATPVFGMTTRRDDTTTILLNTPAHTVFGQLVMNTDATEFLHRISTIPTYSVDRPISVPTSLPSQLQSSSSSLSSDNSSINDNNPLSTSSSSSMINKPMTDAIYNVQRDFFRSTAKALGDGRVNKLYNGKLLRRVEVTQVGVL